MNPRPPSELPEITGRQREVAALVARGLTNSEIAERLGISLDGAKYHVSELLNRLGLERRGEIADWYRAQSRMSRPFHLLSGPGVTWAVAAAAAIAFIGLYFAVSSALTETERHTVFAPLSSGEMPASSPSIADGPDINDILLVRPEETSAGPRGLYLIDADTGRELNFLPLDIAPMATRRLSASEVVISDTIFRTRPDGTSEAINRVKVFNASLSTLQREFLLAGRRISYAVYAPAMELSFDEQTLWYITTSVRDTVECADASWDAALCEIMSAVAMDVDTGAILSHTELPQNCGYPALNRDSTRGMIVACTNRATVLVLQEDGTVVASEDFGLAGGFEPEITRRAGIARLRVGFEAPDGSLGVVLSSGKLLFRRPAEISPTLVSIADPSLLPKSGGRVTSTAAGRVNIGLGTDYTNGVVERVAILDIRSLTITRLFAVGDAVGFGSSRQPAGEFIAVRHDGSVEVSDFAAGGPFRQLVTPDGALGTEVIP